MCADVVMWARGLPLNKADLNSLDFVINRFLLNSSNLDVVRYCQEQFCFELPSVILGRRRTKFEAKFSNFLSNKY